MSTNYTEHLGLTLWDADDPVLRTEFNANHQKLDAFLASMPRMAVGSYEGTGVSGSDAPNTLSFDFQPMLVAVVADSSYAHIPGNIFIRGQGKSSGLTSVDNSAYADNLAINWVGNTLSWYYNQPGNQPMHQLNESGRTYRYFAIGV